jgi:hypothetical protein
MLRSSKMWQIWYFAMFLSISLPLSRNLTPSLSYHNLLYVNESRRWQTFSLFALSELVYSLFSLSELVCTKNVFYPIIIPYFLTPSFFPFGAFQTDRQTNFKFQHPLLAKFFFFPTQCAGPYLQAQLYWAGRTMGWMADWTSHNNVLCVSFFCWIFPESRYNLAGFFLASFDPSSLIANVRLRWAFVVARLRSLGQVSQWYMLSVTLWCTLRWIETCIQEETSEVA